MFGFILLLYFMFLCRRIEKKIKNRKGWECRINFIYSDIDDLK